MKGKDFTRYFLFTRVNPVLADYELLVKMALQIDSFIGYNTVLHEGKTRLVGVVALRGRRTFAEKLYTLFPNFHLTRMSGKLEIKMEMFDVMLGEFPFSEVKINLFEE